ncbi:MAG: cytochrome P450 [Actinobacteria bacterium]|nr:cytochrome P450 [Actinomycetota bacterium]
MPGQEGRNRRPAAGRFPLGASITLAGLSGDPHPLLARLRAAEPVSWLPALNGWLVTRRDLALRVLRDARTFTVDDPRFSTARVVGPSMLSLDGAEHARHRGPFTAGFSHDTVTARLSEFSEAESARLVAAMRPAGQGDLRREVAGPLAVAVIAEALGLGSADPADILAWYSAIVTAVTDLAGEDGQRPGRPPGPEPGQPEPSQAEPSQPELAGTEDARTKRARAGAEAFGQLDASLRRSLAAAPAERSLLAGSVGTGGLAVPEAVSNAAVLMFGGIETSEGMISNLMLHLLSNPDQLRLVVGDPALMANAIEESLRLEPAAAVVDRYATADASIGGAQVRRGDLVSVSLAGAGRDPAVFSDPDRFDVRRPNARQHLTFAHGPHFCLGAHLARLETAAAVQAMLRMLPGLRLDPERPSAPAGLVFRKPPSLAARWDPA